MIRTAATRVDVEAILANAARDQICRYLDGRFIPISMQDPPEGPSAGLTRSTGAWWVRSCRPALLGNAPIGYGTSPLVGFELAGPGWAWVDEGKWGFSVRRFVFFRALASFTGSLELLAFDPQSDVASVVLHPQGLPVIRAGHVGEIETHVEGLGLLWGPLIPIVGAVADSDAPDIADNELNDAFRRRLSSDATATINLRTGQVDFVLRLLASGVAPLRPFADPLPEGDHFVINEQQALHPGMPRVVGPFPPAAGALIDLSVDGAPVRYRAECRAAVEAAFGPALESGSPPKLAQSPTANAGTVFGRETRAIFLPCPWYLLTETDADSFVGVRVHGGTFLGPIVR